MANLYIAEFSGAGIAAGGMMQSPFVPAMAEQKVAFTTAAQSAAFNAGTRLIAVQGDANCHIAFGTAPIATAANFRHASGVTYFYAVQPGSGMKLSVYDGIS